MLRVIFASLILFIVVTLVNGYAYRWRQERRPKLFGTQMPQNASSPHLRRVQRKVVAYHNYFRTNVKPSAANMLQMSWHKPSAEFAQNYSDKCVFMRHDNASDRWTSNYGGCGQNIFVSSHQVPWFFAIKTWFLEYQNFTYGSPKNDLGVIGHYTQLVWATSHKVGCGYTECKYGQDKVFYNYICNYCPAGNYLGILGKPYIKGPSCKSCPKDCSPKTKLCTNFCPFADLWVNCGELNRQWRQWLCKNRSKEGIRRRKHCMATCVCSNKIVQQYPKLKPVKTKSSVQYNNDTLIVGT